MGASTGFGASPMAPPQQPQAPTTGGSGFSAFAARPSPFGTPTQQSTGFGGQASSVSHQSSSSTYT